MQADTTRPARRYDMQGDIVLGKRIISVAAAALILAGLGCTSDLAEREMPDSIVQAAG